MIRNDVKESHILLLKESFLTWPEKRKWLEENFKQRANVSYTEFDATKHRYTYFYFKEGIEVIFSNKSDAMLFKLIWGGR
jgi:hypothetical protein